MHEVDDSHALQAFPMTPHEFCSPAVWHTPLESQQPRAQVTALH